MAAGLRVLLALAAVLAALGPTAARKPRPVRCEPGVFAMAPANAAQVTSGIGISVEGVELTSDGRVRVGACVAKARVKATVGTTHLSAIFPRCGGAHRLKLVGAIPSPACDEMQGSLHAAHRPKEVFTARRTLPTTSTTLVSEVTTTTAPSVSTTTSVPISVSTTSTLPAASCGNDVLDVGEACDHDPQCGRRAHCTPRCTCEPLPGDVAETSQVLIDDALRAGRIDLGTALLYRAYALFADPRLPAEFDGVGTEPEDSRLLIEIADATLSDAARALLEPFTVRPTDPRSVFSTGYAAPAVDRSVPRAEPASCTTVAACTDWMSTDTAHFRVWSCGDVLATVRADVATEAEGLYGPMTAYMGAPVPDEADNDGTPKTDIYLVEPNQARLRDGVCKPIVGGAGGQTHTAPPQLFNVGSGTRITAAFILLPVAAATDATERESTLAHEFFHVLQLSASESTLSSWLRESTAVWAEWKFVPRTTAVAVHSRFRTYQSRLFLSLDTNQLLGQFSLAYAAYIWWYFAEQEGGPNVVAAVWSNAANGAGPNQAANEAFPFADHFRDFIVRNLDDTPLVGASLPTYQGAPMDPKFPFPQPVADIERLSVSATSITGVAASTSLDYLSEQVFGVDVSEDVRKLTFDFSALPGADKLDVEILLRTTNPPDPAFAAWQRRRPVAGKLTLCRDKGDPQVFEAYVILGNHDWSGGGKIAGSWKVSGGSCGYPRRVGMDFTATYTVDAPDGTGSAVWTWTGSGAFALDTTLSAPFVGDFLYHLEGASGTVRVHGTSTSPEACESDGSASFTVPPSVPSQDNDLFVLRHVFEDPTKATYQLSLIGDLAPITVHTVCGSRTVDEEQDGSFVLNSPLRDVPWHWPIVDDFFQPGGDVYRMQVQLSGSDFVPDE